MLRLYIRVIKSNMNSGKTSSPDNVLGFSSMSISLPGQMSLPWDKQKVTESTEVHEVAEKFIQANCYNSTVPGIGFGKR